MKRLFSIVVALCVGVMSLSAQQNLWQGEGLKSPEVNADGSVTFRLFAPEAESVKVTGDFLSARSEAKVGARRGYGGW